MRRYGGSAPQHAHGATSPERAAAFGHDPCRRRSAPGNPAMRALDTMADPDPSPAILHARANELRRLAANTRDAVVRQDLLRLADIYMTRAREIERKNLS